MPSVPNLTKALKEGSQDRLNEMFRQIESNELVICATKSCKATDVMQALICVGGASLGSVPGKGPVYLSRKSAGALGWLKRISAGADADSDVVAALSIHGPEGDGAPLADLIGDYAAKIVWPKRYIAAAAVFVEQGADNPRKALVVAALERAKELSGLAENALTPGGLKTCLGKRRGPRERGGSDTAVRSNAAKRGHEAKKLKRS